MKLSLNLATKVYPNRRALIVGTLLLLFVVSLSLTYALYGLLIDNNRHRLLTERMEELSRNAPVDSAPLSTYSPEALESQRLLISLANRLLEEDNFRWTTLLDQLEEVLPVGVRLISISPSFKGGAVNITGTVRDIAVLRKVLDRLLASTYFSDVRLARQMRIDKQDSVMAVGFDLKLVWEEAL